MKLYQIQVNTSLGNHRWKDFNSWGQKNGSVGKDTFCWVQWPRSISRIHTMYDLHICIYKWKFLKFSAQMILEMILASPETKQKVTRE